METKETKETYRELRLRHHNEFSALPIFFAFSSKQLKEGMESFGLTMEDTKEIRSIGNGAYIRKGDSKIISDCVDRHEKEFNEAIANDKTGEKGAFIFEMLSYELANHEFCITGDTADTLDALGLDMDDIENNPCLKHGLSLAIKENYWEK